VASSTTTAGISPVLVARRNDRVPAPVVSERFSMNDHLLIRQGSQLATTLLLAGAVVALSMNAVPGDHDAQLDPLALGGVTAVLVLAAIARFAGRRASAFVLQAVMVAANLLVSASIAVLLAVVGATFQAELFYLLPLVVAGCYLGRRFVHLSVGLVALGYSAALVAVGLRAGSVVDLVTASAARAIAVVAVLGTVALTLHRHRRRSTSERDRLVELADTDPLTGLLNRRGFDRRIGDGSALAGRSSVVIADLDRFKEINDRHGHDAGDRVLTTVAETLRSAVRDDDLLVRLGGEEFLLVFPGSSVELAADRVEQLAAELRTIEIGDRSVTASFGVTDWARTEQPSDVFRRADLAMYDAKRSGREQTAIRRAGGAFA
jgi:diguanylate cyclase (GGDEF)-like protein